LSLEDIGLAAWLNLQVAHDKSDFENLSENKIDQLILDAFRN